MGGWKADAKKNAINRLKGELAKEKALGSQGASLCIAAIDRHRKDNMAHGLEVVVTWLHSEGRPSAARVEKIMELVRETESADNASKGVLPPWG